MNIDLKDVFSALGKQSVYLTVTLLSGIFITLSIIYGRYISLGVLTLLFSVTGIFWRFLIIDLRKLFSIGKTARENIVITAIFHIVNLVLISIWACLLAKNQLFHF